MEAVWPPELVLRQLLSYVHYKSVLFAYLRTPFQRSVGGHLRDLPVQLLEIFASQYIVLDSMIPSFGFTRLLCFVSGPFSENINSPGKDCCGKFVRGIGADVSIEAL